jgi:predicted porin
MKRLTLITLSLALAGTATTAHAQSSVSLYGLVDAGLGFVKTNSGNQYGMVNGSLNGDRWGLKGSEDLGGGLQALF